MQLLSESNCWLFFQCRHWPPFLDFLTFLFWWLPLLNWHDFWYCHNRAPSWIFSSAENLASSSLQDGATRWLYYVAGTTYQTTQPNRSVWNQFQLAGWSHKVALNLTNITYLSFWFGPLNLDFECGTPSLACFTNYHNFLEVTSDCDSH